MGDAGEGLIDSESRIQERREELERARDERRAREAGLNKQAPAEVESLRLARVELERQFNATTHERRRAALTEALSELDRRLADLQKPS
jgi:hypothetical protein